MQIFKIYHGQYIYIYIYAENIFEEALIEDICIQIYFEIYISNTFFGFQINDVSETNLSSVAESLDILADKQVKVTLVYLLSY